MRPRLSQDRQPSAAQNRRFAAQKGTIPQPQTPTIFRIILYWNQNPISGSFFDWKMLVKRRWELLHQ